MSRAARLIIFLTVALVLAAWVAFFYLRRERASQADAPPVTTGTFADGSSVVIEQVEFANELAHTGMNPPGFFNISTNTRGSSYSVGSHAIEHNFRNGKLDEVRLVLGNPALLIQLTARHADGTDEWDSLITDRQRRRIEQVHYDADGKIDRTEEVPEDTPHLLTVEVEDGASGWRRMYPSAPLFPDRGSHVLYIPEFPRSPAVLRIRVTREGEEPIELTIPNPDPRTTVAAWEPTKVPHEIDLGDVIVRLEGLRWDNYLERPTPSADIEVVSKPDGQPEGAFRLQSGEWETEWGDVADNLFPLPGTRLAKYSALLSRDHRYTFERLDCEIIATGTWPDDGSLPILTPTAQAAAWGLTEVKLAAEPGSPTGGPRDWEQLAISIAGETKTASGNPLLYDPSSTIFAPFLGGADQSAGSTDPNSTSTSYFGTNREFEASMNWALPSVADVAPGTQIELALPPQRSHWDFEFIVELPPLPEEE